MTIPFSLIVALDSENGIGKDGRLPWQLPPDLKHFKEVTCKVNDPQKQNAVVMGRKTWDSVPEKFRPLAGRMNVVLSRNQDLKLPAGVLLAGSFDQALKRLEESEFKEKIESVFVIGGGEIFTKAIELPACQKLYVTHIESAFSCDTHFPPFQQTFRLLQKASPQKKGPLEYYFAEYGRT